jgi:hypothetical protein
MTSFKEFRAICQPIEKVSNDMLIGKLLYRKLSYFLTFLFVHLKFSANMVSFVGMIISLFGISLFALSSNVKLHFIGVILLQISIIIDYSDGEVARYRFYQDNNRRKETNISGKFMDNMGHFTMTPLAVFFFGYRIIHFFPEWSSFLLILSFLTAMTLQGIPNLVMSDIIVNSIKKNPALMDNNIFRKIVSSRINIMLGEENQLSHAKGFLFKLAKLYRGLDVFSLEILAELLLSWSGYSKSAEFLGFCVLSSLLILFTLNYIRTFRRNFLYLNRAL